MARRLFAAVGMLTVAACAGAVNTMDESGRNQVAQAVDERRL